MSELHDQIQLKNLTRFQYLSIASSVVEQVLMHHFRAGEYAKCRGYIEELNAQSYYQDLANLRNNWLHSIHCQQWVSLSEEAEEAAVELDKVITNCLEGVEVVSKEPFDVIPSYSSKQRLAVYFHTPGISMPLGLLPNADTEVEETLKFFINRRDSAGLVHYVTYQLTEFEECQDRVEVGHLETCYLIMVLLLYYEYLGAQPELLAEVQQLTRTLQIVLLRYRPRWHLL